MPSRKSAKDCQILPWLSAKKDCKEGRFLQIGNSLMLSENFQKLSVGARWVYLALCMESGGKRTVKFPHSAAKKFGISPRSYDRQIKELLDAKFIEPATVSKYQGNQFYFSLEWKGVRQSDAPTPQNLRQIGATGGEKKGTDAPF
ncbi:MAG: hypothetical protein LUI14_02130 [Lachnospiraceae bacterium]|nr:hypothetical protein [Lachnospiraceae bacterium]